MKFEKALFVFKFKMKTLPAQFRKYFSEVSSVHERSTRASTQNNYFILFLKKSKLQNSIRYQGPRIWNSLDSTIKNSKSIKSFKSNLKRTLLEKYSLVLFSGIKASITYIPLKCVSLLACFFFFFGLLFRFRLLFVFTKFVLFSTTNFAKVAAD